MGTALLAGILATHGIGEQRLAPELAADARLGPLGLEGYWSGADKIESPGWLAKAAADLHAGPVFAGVARSHRHTAAWDKDATWIRAGLQKAAVRVLLEKAVGTPNREWRAEAQLRGRLGGGFTIQPRVFYESYRDMAGQPHSGYGTGVSVGYSTR